MTKRRLYTLVGGVAVLAGVSWWRLSDPSGPPSAPPRPDGLAPPSARQKPTEAPSLSTFEGKTMGTTYSVKFVPPQEGLVEMARVATESALLAVNESMSTYDPKSEISILNDAQGEEPLPVSEELFAVLELARAVHGKTEGAFDITVGPLVEAFGFGPAKGQAAPRPESLEALRALVGMELLQLDAKARSLQKKSPGVAMDLGGIAKGFGVDQVAGALKKMKIESYMVEVGGEIRTQGVKADGSPWVLAIEEPVPGERRVHGTLSLPKEGAALATSGDYRNFRKIDGKLVSHTFDPRTKEPVARRTASASVVRPTAAEADALATAMTVLPPEEAIQIANQQGYAVYLLTHAEEGGFVAHASKEWEALGMKTHQKN